MLDLEQTEYNDDQKTKDEESNESIVLEADLLKYVEDLFLRDHQCSPAESAISQFRKSQVATDNLSRKPIL